MAASGIRGRGERRSPVRRSPAARYGVDIHLSNLKACLHWLLDTGVPVERIEMNQATPAPFIHITPHPALARFACQTESYGRREVGNQVIFKFRILHRGCWLLWEGGDAP